MNFKIKGVYYIILAQDYSIHSLIILYIYISGFICSGYICSDRTFRLVYSDYNHTVIHISLSLHFRTYVSFIISGYSYYVNMLVTRL